MLAALMFLIARRNRRRPPLTPAGVHP